MYEMESYTVAVIGAGHAGVEAALSCARMGCKTVLFTISLDQIANMPCNPSIGGIGKGHLVKELDAMGGAMGVVTDEAGIQFRILNGSKGAAVQATRAQIDRQLYRRAMRERIEGQENLSVFQQADRRKRPRCGHRDPDGLLFQRAGCRALRGHLPQRHGAHRP